MKLPRVQILRALAAALVVYVHALMTFEARIGAIDASAIASLGDLGVKLFFCISGFIIFTSSSSLSGGVNSSVDFIVKRCIRVLPLYWAATTIYALKLGVQGQLPSANEFVCSLLFIPYLDSSGLMRPVLGQGWTLNFEMAFYAVAALLLLSRSRWRYFYLAAGLLGIVVLNRIWLAGAQSGAPSALGTITSELLLFFVGGILVGICPAKAAVFGRVPPLMGSLAAVALAAVAMTSVHESASTDLLFVVEWLCCTAAVYAASVPDAGRRQLLLQPVVAAGDGSYSTYLLHGFVMGSTARLLSFLQVQIPAHWFATLMVLMCSVIGVLCFKYFEKPAQRALTNFWNLTRMATRAGRAHRAPTMHMPSGVHRSPSLPNIAGLR